MWRGLKALYSSNTFFIESSAALRALLRPEARTSRQLLLPRRLDSITWLELRWDVRSLFGERTGAIDDRRHWHLAREDMAQAVAHLRHVGDTFPNVRRLVLSFGDFYQDHRVRPAQILAEIDRVLLRPIADSVARLASLEHRVVVELPSNVFRVISGDKHELCGAPGLPLETEERGGGWGEGKCVWVRYPLSGCPSAAGHPAKVAGVEDDQGLFYYIKEGIEGDLYWDYSGKPRSTAFGIHAGGHGCM
jgi:hypothetical protein